MKQRIRFSKLQGLGNDFVLINAISNRLDAINLSDLARRLCDRNFGIGADGLLLVLESSKSDIRMRIFNADGSEAQTCGNGLRCFAKFIYENQLIEKELFSVETLAGVAMPALIIKNNRVDAVEVDLGIPKLERSQIPMKGPAQDLVLAEALHVNGEEFSITAVSMGNPHAVVFVDDLKRVDLDRLGPLFEGHPVFPEHVNTEFVQILNRNEIVMIVWERGAGKTLACGTGACAAVVAGVLNNKLDRKVLVHLPGGRLNIEWQESDEHVVMTGPAEEVFHGEIDL